MKANIESLKNFLASMKLMLLILFVDITVCNNDANIKKYFAELLKEVDKVQIQFFVQGDTLTQTLTKKHQLDIYKQVINGKQTSDLKCDSTGRLLYFVKDTLRFEAYFQHHRQEVSLRTAVLHNYLKPDIYKTLFTYRAGMGVDEYFYQLRKEKK